MSCTCAVHPVMYISVLPAELDSYFNQIPHTSPLPGGIYEYSVENASSTAEPNLEKRTAKLQKAVARRAEEVRRNALRLEFQQPPGEGGKGGWMSPYLGPRPPS